MPNRFLNNITINDEYTFPSEDGSANQVIATDGSGELSFVDQNVVITVKNISGGSLSKGTVVHTAPSATPPSGNVIEVIAADYDDATKMPAIGVLNETIANGAEGAAVMMGAVSGIDTSSFSIGDELYVGNLGAFTNSKPATAGQLIQKIAVVIKSHASNGLIKIFGAGRSNDVPLPLYIDNTNQRVGISEPSPDYKLHVNGQIYSESDSYPVYYLKRNTSATGGSFSTLTGIASAFKLETDSSGTITDGFGGGIVFSIGDTSPNTAARIYARRDGGDQTGALQFWGGADGNTLFTTMRASGNVGIGTEAPAEKLVVSEDRSGTTAADQTKYTLVSKSTISSGTPGTGGIKVAYDDGTNEHGFGLVSGSSSADFLTTGPMHFYTNSDLNTQSATGFAMVIDNNQNLGIGVTSITAGNRLEVAGGTIGIDDYLVHNGNTNTKFGFVANDNFAITTAGVERVRVTSGGSVGIVTNNPSAKLDVEGNAVLGSSGNTATGSYAVALNQNNTASSLDSLATGENTTASGRQAFSGGYNTTASGPGSFAIGGNSVASGANSLCAGGDGTTTGSTATSIGTLNDATGDYSFAAGYNSTASGLVSFAMGSGVTASGSKATVFGEGNNIAGELDFSVGAFNTSPPGLSYGNIIAGYNNDITSYSAGAASSLNLLTGTQNVIGSISSTNGSGDFNIVGGANNKVGHGVIGTSPVSSSSNKNIVQGTFNTMLAYDSITLGQYNRTSYGGCSATIGYSLITPTNGSTSGNAFSSNAFDTQFIVGRWNNFNINSYTQGHRFAVGNGTGDANRFTALNVLATTGTARVGIAQDVPAYVLDVTGQARFTGGYTTSDERLKENIQDNTLGLNELKQLRTVSYDWKSGKILGRSIEDIATNKNCRGLIAQEAEIVSPDLVDTDDSEYGIKSIDSGALTAMLIKAVQEQQDIIESLKERIQALENN